MLTWLFGGGGHATGVVLLVLVNVLAFGYGVALIKLARFEGMSDETARKAVWLLALAPPAFVLVMGYTEALAGLLGDHHVLRAAQREDGGSLPSRGCSRGCAGRRARCLLVPALIEIWRSRGRAGPWVPRVAALLAPVVGAVAYLSYIAIKFGDFWQPLSVQQHPQLHGKLTNPITVIHRAISGAGDHELGNDAARAVAGALPAAADPDGAPAARVVHRLERARPGLDARRQQPRLGGALLLERVPVRAGGGVAARPAAVARVLAVSSALLIVYASFAFLQFFVP